MKSARERERDLRSGATRTKSEAREKGDDETASQKWAALEDGVISYLEAVHRKRQKGTRTKSEAREKGDDETASQKWAAIEDDVISYLETVHRKRQIADRDNNRRGLELGRRQAPRICNRIETRSPPTSRTSRTGHWCRRRNWPKKWLQRNRAGHKKRANTKGNDRWHAEMRPPPTPRNRITLTLRVSGVKRTLKGRSFHENQGRRSVTKAHVEPEAAIIL